MRIPPFKNLRRLREPAVRTVVQHRAVRLQVRTWITTNYYWARNVSSVETSRAASIMGSFHAKDANLSSRGLFGEVSAIHVEAQKIVLLISIIGINANIVD